MAKLCRARVTLPSRDGQASVQFICTLMKQSPDQALHEHAEHGRVRAQDGTVKEYHITWIGVDPEVWRQEAPKREG